MNLFGGGKRDPANDRDPDGKRTVTRRQLLARLAFYMVVFALIIWWAKT